MNPQQGQVDYDALAKQYGATSSVDYDALAKQYGATSSTPPPQAITSNSQFAPTSAVKGYAGQVLDSAKKAVSDAATGFVKKGVQTMNFLGPAMSGNPIAAAMQYATPDPSTELHGTAEKIGGGVEQAAEMMATGGPLKQGAEALASYLPWLGKAAAPAARIAAESINTGGNAALHGENPTVPAIIGAGGSALGEVAQSTIPWLRKSASDQYERALAPTTKVNKAIAQKIAPEMIQRGLKGNLDSLAGQASGEAGALRPQLDAAYQALPPTSTAGSGPKIINALEQLKGKYVVNGMPAQPAAVNAISGVQDIVRQYGDDISPNSLRQLKQVFDEPVAAKGGFAGADLTTQYGIKAQKAAANSIRSVLSDASPDVAALNKELTFWLNVQQVTQASALRRTGQEGGLLKVLSPLAGASGLGFGVATHNAQQGVEAAAVATLTGLAAHAMRTPGWRTASAVFKNQFADALARGSVGDTVALVSRLGSGVQGSSQSPR